MTQNEINPKVFPVINQGNVYETGMDLRDYFAGQYLQGHLASEYYAGANNSIENLRGIATTAYEFAEAMLNARKNQ